VSALTGPPAADALAGNLEVLRERFPEVAEALSRDRGEKLEVLRRPDGTATISCDGVLLASAYDPRGEGERLADEMLKDPADVLVAVGFGLGHPIESARSRTRAQLIVFEPSPARLRAALALREPLAWLRDESLHLCVSVEGLRAAFRRVYLPGHRVVLWTHPVSLRLDAAAIDAALGAVSHAKHTLDLDVATRVAMMERWAQAAVANLPHALRSPPVDALAGLFRGRPAVVAAAGPSLDQQLPRLRDARDRVVLIAIGQSLAALRAAEIEPDLVHVRESQDVSHQLEAAGGVADANLVLVPQVHPRLFELPVRARFVAWPETEKVGAWIARALGFEPHLVEGATVAQGAVLLAHWLGCDPVVLVGQDLAFTGGRLYASHSAYGRVGVKPTADGGFVYTGYKWKANLFGRDDDAVPDEYPAPAVWVEGWDGGRVPTSPAYASFIDSYREIGGFLARCGVRLLNCTEGGARIPGLEHLRLEDVLRECRPQGAGDARAAVSARFDAFAGFDLEPLVRAADASARHVEALAKAARSAERTLRRVAPELTATRGFERKLSLLRALGRVQLRLRDAASVVPWLDAVVQPELHRFGLLLAPADSEDATAEKVVEQTRALVAVMRAAAARGRDLAQQIRARLADVGSDASPVGRRAGRAEPGRS
jgi:hypothetical protein